MANRDVTNDASNADKTTPTITDKVMVIDVSTNPDSLKETELQNLFKTITGLTEDTSPDSANDLLVEYDASAAAAKKVKLVTLVNGFAEDTNPDESADFLLSYDVSAAALKKVKYSNIASSSSVVVQAVHTQTGAVATGTTVMPLDDTIPQNTEGDEYMTRAITPTSATNKLVIEVVWIGAASITSGNIGVALFQDTTAGALAASIGVSSVANDMIAVPLRHEMVAGTTSSTTFKIRAGIHSAGTVTFNGRSAGRIFGGVMASSIRITEILV